MTVRKIGNATIEKVEEICGAGFKPARMFPRFDQEAFDAQKGWMVPDHVEPGSDRLVGSVHTWVVKTGRHTILIDTCLGNHKDRHNPGWNKLNTPFLDRLQACGCKPEFGRLRDVHASACRPCRLEHQARERPLGADLPQRQVPVRQARVRALGDRAQDAGQGDQRRLVRRFGAAVVEAGKAVMIDSDHQPDPLLTIKDYPGHTPGSIAINLKDGGKQACFSGDIMHHPIQVYHPDWSSQFCSDQELSAKSRRKLLEDCVESNALLCPAHFPGANAGYIKPAGQRLPDRMGQA